jgi:RNA polymerase sigma-70 factor (ECF subfamily)
MNPESHNQRLSGISTDWMALRDAHLGTADVSRAAQELLLRRYRGAVYRYLLRAVGDLTAAEDLAQDFAVGLVRGDFRQADPQRGRFRNYVKAVLFHLVAKHRKGRRKRPQPVSAAAERLAAAAGDEGAQFDDDWRNELLARTWEALAVARPTLHAALHLRARHAEMRSPELAAELSRQLDKPLTAEAARQLLHRAREKFADLLIDAVANSLEAPSANGVAEELRDLNLLEHCRAALDRYARKHG